MNEEEMNRFSLGKLSPEEARSLAQRALDDPDLFDELTALSVARAGLSVQGQARKKRVWPWVAIAAAAAAVLIAVVWPVFRGPAKQMPAVAAVASEPMLLARARDGANSVFRGVDEGPTPREPRAIGAVAQVEDGFLTFDLGSLDGLSKGVQLQAVRNGQPVGTIDVVTVFRDKARGTSTKGTVIRAGDQVRVPDSAFLGALLDEIDTRSARGDLTGARRVASRATHLQAGFAATDYADLNNLAVIAELRGDAAGAESLYRQALDANPPDVARKSIQANLARVKETK